MTLQEIIAIYSGSDGDATKALYGALEARGPLGVIALNVFRAQKTSERAKVYRRGHHRSASYDRKQWSMSNLCAALEDHGSALGIPWGWGEDPEQPKHRWVLYIDTPAGQVSFHTDHRLTGPDYPHPWDGVRGMGGERACRFAAQVLA